MNEPKYDLGFRLRDINNHEWEIDGVRIDFGTVKYGIKLINQNINYTFDEETVDLLFRVFKIEVLEVTP